MWRPNLLLITVIVVLHAAQCGDAHAGQIIDATGRTVVLSDHITRVLPAGPPAAVLLMALAPDLLIGWPHPPSREALAFLPDAVADVPTAPKVTGGDDTAAAIEAVHPDLILDYGDVSPRYAHAAEDTQQKTGIPDILLDGRLAKIPEVLRHLGAALHREARAEALARMAETILAEARPAAGPLTVVVARGADGLTLVAPGTGSSEVFAELGWTVLASDGVGTFRHATFADVARLDPDWLVFSDPAMRDAVAHPPWTGLRAVVAQHVLFAPRVPFGWLDEPPSINRLIGLAWLGGSDGVAVATLFNATVYGRVLSVAQMDGFKNTGQPPSPK